jgi:putative holliday junction resolvase
MVSVLLGIDLGERRIGVATADTRNGAVLPLRTLARGSVLQDAAAIARLCAERGAEAVIVGLPLHMDGTESEQSRRTRAWVEAVAPLLEQPLTFRDERRSSELAEMRMGRLPRGRSGGPPSPQLRRAWRARIDREAAAGILQRELDARATHAVETGA